MNKEIEKMSDEELVDIFATNNMQYVVGQDKEEIRNKKYNILLKQELLKRLSKNNVEIDKIVDRYFEKNAEYDEIFIKEFKKRLVEEMKPKLYNIIGKLDNGSHSSSQLQGVDEAIIDLINNLK